MEIKKKITNAFQYTINISEAGLVAIFVSARCKSNEDLRVEINGLKFREIPPEKNVQLFNIPPAFNGSKLKGLGKIVIFLTVLDTGKHTINLIPRNGAFIEEIEVQELAGKQDLEIEIENKAEDGNRRPWITFVLIDLPLKYLVADIVTKWRFRDSDDVKLIVDNKIQKNNFSIFYRNWLWAGSVFKEFFQKENQIKNVETNLLQGIHYIEFWADRMPVLRQIKFNLSYTETKAEIRAGNLIRNYIPIIKYAANEFEIDPVIVGAVIYQEQATNVNFIDTLTDYIGGLLHLNTSIGIGQVRVKTAEQLEKYYPNLDPYRQNSLFVDYNMVRVERLKDPLINIKYVAAKIHFSQERWEKAGFDINDRPEILGTLYNIEDVFSPVKPHANPEPNEFGKGVKENYKKVEKLLEL